MRTIRNLFAAMLIGFVAMAFQVDADAQSRSVNRSSSDTQKKQTVTRSSSSVSHPAAAKPSVQTNRSSAPARQTVTRQSSIKTGSPSVQSSRPANQNTRPSVQSTRPSGQNTKPSVQSTRPSGQSTRPAVQVNRPNSQTSKPSVQTRPSGQTRPSVQAKPSSGPQNNRPNSGAVNDRKPSTTVNRPNRPVDNRPAQRPGEGSAFKPEHAKPPVKVHPNHKPDKPRVHPSHRDFIAFDRPACFWTPHYHYFGHRVRVLPARARLVTHFGMSYYCYNDIWYRSLGGHYIICRPPFGTVLAANLIADMAWTAVRFSYYNTVLNKYRQINENNRYIAEQNEIIARNNAVIAAQNAAIAVNQKQAETAFTMADNLGLVQSYAAADSEYFYQDGVFYAKDASGEYKVILPPAGALVDSLPDDYEMVTLKGEEYYKVDDTVYKVTLVDGKPYFEVLGQLYS